MIIWSGFGILVIVSLLLGFLASFSLGPVLDGLFGRDSAIYLFALSFLFAALINFLIGKLLYRNGDRVLVDPQTRQSYVVSPKHSLFFIPFRFFTYLYFVAGIFVLAIGIFFTIAAAKVPTSSESPSEREGLANVEDQTQTPEKEGEEEPEAAVAVEPNPQSVEPGPLASEREWMDSKGRKMSAKFVSMEGDKVVFRKSDGNTYRFPFDKLSEDDQKLIEEHENP